MVRGRLPELDSKRSEQQPDHCIYVVKYFVWTGFLVQLQTDFFRILIIFLIERF
jgi:hypothetical protein